MDARRAAPRLSRDQLVAYLLDVLENDARPALTRRAMYEPLWDRLPHDLKASWVVLRVGDEISKALADMGKAGLVRHDSQSGEWWLPSRERPGRVMYESDGLFEL